MIEFLTADWQAPKGVKTLITTRFGGVSQSPFDDFNLATNVGDDIKNTSKNRQILQQFLPAKPVWLNQTHSTNIVRLPNESYLDNPPDADASFSFAQNTVCVVLTADCLPVFFSDLSGKKVAVAHAGWRGLAAGILEKTANKISQNKADLQVYLAPAIGAKSFEVGYEVKMIFTKNLPETEIAFTQLNNNKFLVDIYKIAILRLNKIGVKNITGGDFDTKIDKRFFSYRKENITGRIASLIWFE